jgi:HK97 family phage major capsid protein/HK97 family phage prohead protease
MPIPLPDEVVTKTTATASPTGDPLEFVMSDASVDRMGDVIEPDGWQLGNFTKNPVALFGHDSDYPIGTWRDVGVVDGQLRGRLELMPAVSERLRELHTAVAAGVLRAVSVGFRPVESAPLESSKTGGIRFTKSELVEGSLVSVPANPNALRRAAALGLSRETRNLIFGVSADEDPAEVIGRTGVPAVTHPERGTRHMTLSERIKTAQDGITTLRDQVAALLGAHPELDEETTAACDELNGRIEASVKGLETLQRAEKALALTSEMVSPAGPVAPLAAGPQRPFALPKKAEKPAHLVFRAFVVEYLRHVTKKPVDQILAEHYGEDLGTRTMVDWLLPKAATVPATNTLTGWAAELVQTQIGEYFDLLMPGSIYGPLSNRGLRVTLGRNGTISLPTRSSTPTVAGSFVAEGAPIPVRQAAFTAVPLGLKKMAVITSFTREISEHSTPQIESLLRQAIEEDTGVAVDTVLIDATAATSVRPAGLRAGVAGLTPTAGGGFAALVGDIKQMVGVLTAANSLRAPVWIMNPAQALSIGLTQNSGGDFPFKAEINGNQLQGFPVITSTTVPATEVILLDAADFMSVEGDQPRFEVSDQATLHMEDTAPQPISTPGSPNVVAAPIRSMFQTDSLALRMILPMNWAMRRSGLVAWMTGVTW